MAMTEAEAREYIMGKVKAKFDRYWVVLDNVATDQRFGHTEEADLQAVDLLSGKTVGVQVFVSRVRYLEWRHNNEAPRTLERAVDMWCLAAPEGALVSGQDFYEGHGLYVVSEGGACSYYGPETPRFRADRQVPLKLMHAIIKKLHGRVEGREGRKE
jgi:hypothetical protein